MSPCACMKFLALSFALFLGLGWSSLVSAFKVAPPQDRSVRSPNGQYVLEINAKSGQHQVKKGSKTLWSFKKGANYGEYCLSNDGRFVFWASWAYVQADEAKKEVALAVYSSEGTVLQKRYAEVSVPRPYKEREIGPMGDFWRVWRQKVTQKEDLVSIAVEGKRAFVIDLSKPEVWRQKTVKP